MIDIVSMMLDNFGWAWDLITFRKIIFLESLRSWTIIVHLGKSRTWTFEILNGTSWKINILQSPLNILKYSLVFKRGGVCRSMINDNLNHRKFQKIHTYSYRFPRVEERFDFTQIDNSRFVRFAGFVKVVIPIILLSSDIIAAFL